MRRLSWALYLAVLAPAAMALATLHAMSAPATLDTSAIENAIGLSGKMMPGGVFRVNVPRSDLHVSIDGIPLKTALALGGYAVYESAPGGALVMGDIPLLESEVAPVESRLTSSGFAITALHNHLLREQPHIMYMHFMKIGDGAELARELHSALQATSFSFAPRAPSAAAPFAAAAQIDSVLRLHGMAHDGIYSVSVARPEKIVVHGIELPPAMGVATGINFQTVAGGKLATTGDFVLTADQVDTVRSALVSHGIEVTALHQHLVGADPTLYFMHFWGAASPNGVLAGLAAAINIVRPS